MATGSACLPLDAPTPLGMLLVLASVLPATALQASTVQQCLSVVEFLDQFISMSTTLRPLGKRSEVVLDVVDNKVSIEQLRKVFKSIAFNFSRPSGRL